MDRNTLVIGGCRSGKSRWALTAAEKRSPARKCFIATCDPQDDEMKARVQRHRQERDPAWQAVESPLRLPQAIATHRDRGDVILVDCLTVWLGNLMLSNPDSLALETGVRSWRPLCGCLAVRCFWSPTKSAPALFPKILWRADFAMPPDF